VDDDERIRDVLSEIISGEEDLDLVGVASGGHEAIALAAEHAPDVVLIDVHMAGGNGVDAVRALAAQARPPQVIALSGYSDAGAVQAMLGAGAAGYLLKGSDIFVIIDAIRAAARGEPFASA
jgi:DNA-binding NarL/FixJ family response regulator